MESNKQVPVKTEREILIEKKTEEVLSLLSGMNYNDVQSICSLVDSKAWGICKDTSIPDWNNH